MDQTAAPADAQIDARRNAARLGGSTCASDADESPTTCAPSGLDVATSAQTALHMPVPVSVR